MTKHSNLNISTFARRTHLGNCIVLKCNNFFKLTLDISVDDVLQMFCTSSFDDPGSTGLTAHYKQSRRAFLIEYGECCPLDRPFAWTRRLCNRWRPPSLVCNRWRPPGLACLGGASTLYKFDGGCIFICI
jgi:hypothetical protein